MPDKLVEIARFSSAVEASMAKNALEAEGITACLDGEAMATWFWYFGSAIGGVRLWVREDDADRALQIVWPQISDGHLGDEPDDLACDEQEVEDEQESEDELTELPEDLIRAWRAALIGLLVLPPLLNLYSTWLLLRHGFFLDRCRNWRVVAASGVNAIILSLAAFIIFLIVRPEAHSQRPFPGRGPLPRPVELERTIPIPLGP